MFKKRVLVSTMILTGCSLLAVSPSNAENLQAKLTRKSIEHFEAFCYRTGADPEKIKKSAEQLSLKPLPKKFLAAVAGPNSTSGEGFMLEWDKTRELYILLGFGTPDSCSIYTQGVDIGPVKEKMVDIYRLAYAQKDDVGLQVSEMYVPGGKRGNKIEAKENGLISITYLKPESGYKSVILSYLPPRTLGKVGIR